MLDAVVTQLHARLQLLALEDQPDILALEALLRRQLGAAGRDSVRGREVVDRDGRAGETADEDLRAAVRERRVRRKMGGGALEGLRRGHQDATRTCMTANSALGSFRSRSE